MRSLSQRLPCQVGGGIRTAEIAQELLAEGAKRVVIGSSLIKDGSNQYSFCGRDWRAMLAADESGLRSGFKSRESRDPGMAATHEHYGGSNDSTRSNPGAERFSTPILIPKDCCLGMPLDTVSGLRALTSQTTDRSRRNQDERGSRRLHAMGVDAVVGMAIYLELLKI